jgi:hypothetical protein
VPSQTGNNKSISPIAKQIASVESQYKDLEERFMQNSIALYIRRDILGTNYFIRLIYKRRT